MTHLVIGILLSGSAAFAAEPVPLAVREDFLSRAKVWFPPETPIGEADLATTEIGKDGWEPEASIHCRYKNEKPTGLTAKVYCVDDNGEQLKVKPYIKASEAATEVAASRLLSALGFGADRMYMVKEVFCEGCPRFAYPQIWWLANHLLKWKDTMRFDRPALERKAKGSSIETQDIEGAALHELEKIDASKGGATRAELDAFRLMAVFLSHWDNKSANQRLVCLSKDFKKDRSQCEKPFLLMDDVGQTFGPRNRELRNWASKPIWSDPATCFVSMKKDYPYDGGTFPELRITEEGRLFLAGLLNQLSRAQVTALFEGAHFEKSEKDAGKRARKIQAWVDTFMDKVRQISDRSPCPDRAS